MKCLLDYSATQNFLTFSFMALELGLHTLADSVAVQQLFSELQD